MSDLITIIMPKGALGAGPDDEFLDMCMRNIALALDPKDAHWSTKYGADYENDVFMMHRFCWCEKESCPWCGADAPNFLHKKSGFGVTWYKYIGRGMAVSKKISGKKLAAIVNECLQSIEPRP